eukprot:PITA_04441
MPGSKEFFSNLEEKDLQLHIELGDDGRYSTKAIGIFTFKRELGSHFHLKNVMYMPRLNKNLIFVVVLEDKQYDVVFSKGKSFLKHVVTRQVKQIGVRVKDLYKLEVDVCVALSSKVEHVQSRDVRELWHRRMGHLYHGALNIMQQITTRLPKCTLDQHDVCKGCTLGKYVKFSFQGRDSKVGAILEQVHLNVCGPFSTVSVAKHKYYVVSQPMWVDAMVEDYDSIMKSNVWEEVLRPENKSVVGSRWIYKVKHADDGSIEKYKAGFVAKGFSHVEGVDYEETFALVARYSSIKAILALVA